MTRPSVSRLWLIDPASLARLSLAPEREMFSLPARSTKLSFPILMMSSPSAVASFRWIVMVKTLCERLDRLLSSVAAVRRLAEPRSRTW